jgi:hypothetical protein
MMNDCFENKKQSENLSGIFSQLSIYDWGWFAKYFLSRLNK